MAEQGGGGGRGGGRGKRGQRLDLRDPMLGFNAVAHSGSSSQPGPSAGPSNQTIQPPPSNTSAPRPISHHKLLDSFRDRLLSVLCVHPKLPTNELPRAYSAKYHDNMPDPISLGFPNMTGMLRAFPSECSVEDEPAPSSERTKQFVRLAPHWDGLRAALEKRREELIAANELVTTSKLLEWLRDETGKNDAQLGLAPPQRFPYLRDLMRLEQSVEVCIGCYLAERLLAASIWDLEQYICRNKEVESFDQLRLGPLVSHHMVWFWFRPTFSGCTAPQVSLSHVALALKRAKDRKRLNLEPADVEKELCKTFRVTSQHDLGVKIPVGTYLGWPITCLKRAREVEQYAIEAAFAPMAEQIQAQAKARAESQRQQLYQQAKENLCKEMQAALKKNPTIMDGAAKQAMERLGVQARKVTKPSKGQPGQDGHEAGQHGEQEGANSQASASTAQPAWHGMDGDEDAQRAPMHPQISVEGLVQVVERLGAGCGTSHASLADLERRVLAHYEGAPHFGALCAGVPSLLQLLEQRPGLAAMLASTEEEGSAAQGRPAVSMAQLLRATAQAVDAYRATHQSTALGEHRAEGTDEEFWVAQAICMQYSVGSVEDLGRGSLRELLDMSQDWRNAASLAGARHVHTASALVCGQSAAKGALDGHSVHDMHNMARAALRSAPMLSDLAQWTQWPAVFQEAVGSLDDPELLDDAMARDGWTALELPGGQLIKVPNTTTLKADFKEGLAHLDPVATVATLLGYVAQEGNCSQVVLEPLIVCICERMRNEKKFSGTAEAHKLLTRFVLRCLSLIPSVLRPMLAHHVFLTPLMTEVMDGDAQVTARHLLQCASTIDEDEHSDDKTTSTAGQGRCLLPMLHALGMHLKLKDLQEHYVEVVWKAGQAAAQDAPGQSVETAVSCTSVAAAINPSHGGPVEASPTAGPLKGTSAEAAGGADDAIELLPHSLRAHFEGKRTAPGPAAGATKQEQHPEGTAGGLEPAQAAVAAATKEEQDAQAVIMQIRTEEFDLVDAQHMTQDKKKRNEREGRMLKMLSKDLYSEAHHFQMELVQNADDNHYSPDTVPLLTFDVFDDKILVKNNELGFSAENVRKICTIGDSSKKNKQGYTGEKGIGFKSVFKVTDKPAIHSNHFHFAFDLTADKMLGYIVPSPVRPLPLDMHNPKEVTTCIELPLKEEFQGRRPESRELRDKFNNLQPVLLLFLRNLRRININNVAGQSFHTILADQDSVYPNCLRLRSMRMSYAKGAEQADVVDTSSKWIHVDKVLQPRNPRQGEKIERTCVSVAYPLPKGTDDHELPQRQPVYAYLPVRSYGLKFVVNANWEVPPSREAVYGLSAFNLELASAIPDLAMEALALLKQMPTPRQDRPHFWIDWWLKTLPVDGEVDEPFVSPARQLRMKAARTRCLPTKSNLYVKPEQAHVCVDEGVRSLLAEERTQQLLDVHFVHPDINSLYSSRILRDQLRVQEFATSDLLHLARRVCSEQGLLQELGLPWLAQLLCCVFANVHEWKPQERKHILAEVKKLPILPLADGNTVSMAQMEQESAAAAAAAGVTAAPSLSSATHLVFFPLECLVQEAAAQAAAQAQQDAAGNATSGGADGQQRGAEVTVDVQDKAPTPAPTQQPTAPVPKLSGLSPPMAPDQIPSWAGAGGPDRASSASAGAQRMLHECGLDTKQMTLRQLHPLLLQVEPSKAYKLRRGLSELGVKEIAAADVVQHHILPMFRNHKQRLAAHQAAMQEDTRQQLRAALTFVALSGLWQDQSTYQQLRACAVVVTTQGPCHIPDAPHGVYLPQSLGNNVVDLPAKFPSHPWVLVDPGYANSSVAARRVRQSDWAYLFAALGAHKWLSLEPTVCELSLSGWQQHLAATAAAGMRVSERASVAGAGGTKGPAAEVAPAPAFAGAHGMGSTPPTNTPAPGAPLASASALAAAPASSTAAADGVGAGGAYVQLHDVACPEFPRLLASITNAMMNPSPRTPSSPATPLAQFMHLAKLMEAQWQSAGYAACMTTHAFLSPAAAAAAAAAAGGGTTSDRAHSLGSAAGSGDAAAVAAAAEDEDGGHSCTAADRQCMSQPVVMVVPTSFALCVRTSAWLLNNDDLPAKPIELFLASGYERWLHGLVPYMNNRRPEPPITDPSVLAAVGVHMKLDLSEALTLLTHWATSGTAGTTSDTTCSTINIITNKSTINAAATMHGKPVYAPDGTEVPQVALDELGVHHTVASTEHGVGRAGGAFGSDGRASAPKLVGNRLATSLAQMGALYSYIWQTVQGSMGLQALVAAFFTKHPLLWLPDKRAEKPPFSNKVVEGTFYSIGCARHLDKACAMEAIPWERQKLRIIGRFYVESQQDLFVKPLWRPTPPATDPLMTHPPTAYPDEHNRDAHASETGTPMPGGTHAGAVGARENVGAGDGVDDGADDDGDDEGGSDGGSEGGGVDSDEEGEGGPRPEDGQDGASSDEEQHEPPPPPGCEQAGQEDAIEERQAGQQQQQQQQQLEREREKEQGAAVGIKQALVQKGPSLQEYVDALQAVADSCTAGEMPYDTARHWAMLIFKMFNRFLNTKREGRSLISGLELRTLLAPNLWGMGSRAPRVFPSMRSTFVSTQDNLLINDDRELSTHFTNVPHVHFLHISEAERKPNTQNPDNSLYTLLRVVGVPQLSTSVHPRVYRDAANFSRFQLQCTIYRALLLAQRFLLSRSMLRGTKTSRTYEELKQAGIVHLFNPLGKCPFKVAAAEKLKVQYILQQRDSDAEPTATPLIDCEAALENNRDLYVTEREGRFDTQQVASELSRLFHPPTVAAILSMPRGSAELPAIAPKREDLTTFLDAALQRFKDGEQEVEKFLSKKECLPLPDDEKPWAELPKEQPTVPLQTTTLPPAYTDTEAVAEPANTDSQQQELEQQQQQQQQQQGQQAAQKKAPRPRHEFNSYDLWASMGPLSANHSVGIGGAGLDGSQTLVRDSGPAPEDGGVDGPGSGAIEQAGGVDAAGMSAEEAAAAAARAERERDVKAAMLRERDHQHAAWAEDDEGKTERGPRSSQAQLPLGPALRQETSSDPWGHHHKQPLTSTSQPQGLHAEPHTAHPHNHGPHIPALHAPRPAPEPGSLFANGGLPGAVSPAKAHMQGAFVWSSAAHAEAVARSAGLLHDFDSSQVLDVLQHTLSHTGRSLMDALPRTDPTQLISPDDLAAIGRVGEQTAFWLLSKLEANKSVTWVNKDQETGYPYDILITDANSNTTFVEVKTSASNSRAFYISRSELEFADKAGNAYHIYHLTGAGTAAPWLRKYINPVKQWTDGSLLTMMTSPTDMLSST